MKAIALALTISLFALVAPALACDDHAGSGGQDGQRDQQKEHHHNKAQSKDHHRGHDRGAGEKTEKPDSKQQDEKTN